VAGTNVGIVKGTIMDRRGRPTVQWSYVLSVVEKYITHPARLKDTGNARVAAYGTIRYD
jgi:hypothetical protein